MTMGQRPSNTKKFPEIELEQEEYNRERVQLIPDKSPYTTYAPYPHLGVVLKHL